jgi:hypothetical protein
MLKFYNVGRKILGKVYDKFKKKVLNLANLSVETLVAYFKIFSKVYEKFKKKVYEKLKKKALKFCKFFKWKLY